MKRCFSSVALLLCCLSTVSTTSALSSPFASLLSPLKTAFTKPAPSPPPSKIDTTPQWLDVLKYSGTTPTFDVLQKTIDFAQCTTYEQVAQFYDKDYVFRGPIVGPITGEEVARTQQGCRIQDAYPDFQRRPFGFTIDPDNPYR
jgi:hypothetical protein